MIPLRVGLTVCALSRDQYRHIFSILIDAEQKAHFLFMTMRCHSPDAFESAPEPEADDEETYVGYADGEIQALPHGDEAEPAADSEDDGWDGDISEDEVGDGPIADEDFFGDDEMEDGPTDEEGAPDGGEMEVGSDDDGDNGEMDVDSGSGGSESGDGSCSGSDGESDGSNDDGDNGEMDVDSGSGGSESGDESCSGSDGESEDSSTGAQEEDVESAWSVSDVEGDGDDGDDDEGCVDDDDSDDQIVRPVRHLRNVVGSDEDGEVTVRAAHPPGTMAVFDELAPADINNPCEFQIKAL